MPISSPRCTTQAKTGLVCLLWLSMLCGPSRTSAQEPTEPQQDSKEDRPVKAPDRAISPAPQKPSSLELIDRLIANMQSVQKRLESKRIDQQTRADQGKVIQTIDELIQAAREQQQRQKNQQQNSQQNEQQSDSSQQESTDQSQQSGESEKNRNSPGNPDTGSPQSTTESTEQPATGDDTDSPDQELSRIAAEKARLAAQRAVLQQQWGHLPIRLRQKILNLSDQKYLPRYENLIRRYYQSLAEKKRTNKQSP